MIIKNLAFAALLASFAVGAAQAQPAAETPGMSRGATIPSGAAQATVPPRAAGATPGMQQRNYNDGHKHDREDMGAGRPGTPMRTTPR